MSNQYRSACNRFDYQPEEVNQRYYELLNNQSEKINGKSLRQQILAALNCPPPIPNEVDEGLEAQWDWMEETEEETEEEIKVYKPNGFSYELVVIPPRILEF